MKLLSALMVLLLIGALGATDEKPTSLTEARNAIEANLRTPEGKAYDAQFGKDLIGKYLPQLRQCKQSAGGDVQDFWLLTKVNKDGSVKEVLLSPTTKIAACDRDVVLKGRFSAPPHDGYWVSTFLKFAH